jgi:hypothetical protein
MPVILDHQAVSERKTLRKGRDCSRCALALDSDPARAELEPWRVTPHQSNSVLIPVVERGRTATFVRSRKLLLLAEGVGFEPTVGLTPRSISSRVP